MSTAQDEISGLTGEEKRALLERLLAEEPDAAPEGFPLSFSQQRLWFLHQLEPGGAAYNIARAVRLAGEPDLAALARCFEEIVRRHETLRTVFRWTGDEPLQVVLPEMAVPLPEVDLRHLPPAEREAEAARWIEAEAGRPFDLATGPLVRVTLLHTAPRESILLLTLHHIVSDGWSAGVFIQEMVTLYQAFSRGLPSPLPELPVQYVDYAVSQREWLQGGELEAMLAYWRERLAGAPPLLELPTDRPRPAVQSFRGAEEPTALGADLSRRVREACRRLGVTPFMTLFAAFAALLHRYTGQTDVVVGSPVANRTQEETEGLIGFFVNTLVLRTDLSGDPGLDALTARVREVLLGAYAHQDLPFERLVDELRPERDLGHAPLFQVVFALQNAPAGSAEVPGISVRPVGVPARTAKFDLTLVLAEADGDFRGSLEYGTDLFEAATVRRLLAHYASLLRAGLAEPDRPVSELPLLSAGERHQILAWSQGDPGEAPAAAIHEIFERQAARTPEATALIAGELRLSYRELDGRANALARRLVARGVRPDRTVGLQMERSAALIVGMLGVLKAGAAYVPLDPDHPRERLAWMREDAGAALVLGADEPLAAGTAEAGPQGGAGPDGLAYVLFTSGSTGRPKGVAVPHRAVVRLVRGAAFAPLGPAETLLHLAPPAFDAATFEIWGALLNGARLVIAPPETRSLEEIGELIARHGVTTLWLTAGLFQRLVDHRPEALRPVRRLLAGGDVLSPDHVRRALAEPPGRVLVNGYGPTENTTFTCCHVMERPEDVERPVPVGRPIARTRVYIADARLGLAPAGVPGELLAGGDGLARGYVDRPDLTAERFVPDPWGAEPGARLYRTGDRARFRPDGAVEFLGRMDRQVKIRGFRVEPGEIEAALLAHPGLREAVVLARPDASGGKRLVAWAVAEPGRRPGVEEIRAFLRERLPEPMIPAAFLFLDAFPLTANGKIDRGALPAPDDTRPDLEQAFTPPRTGLEEILCGIWAEVLGLDRVGVHDNFFSLGGDSLLSLRITSRAQRAGIGVSPLLMFQRQTVAELAAAAGGVAEAPPLLPLPRPLPAAGVPLSFSQQGLWFQEQMAPGSPFYNVPASLWVSGRLDVPALAAAFSEIVRRHEALRTRFRATGGQPAQMVAPPAPQPLPLADLTALPRERREAEARRLAAGEAARGFDLETGPPVRTALARLDAEEHALLITLHHIVADGWSMGVLIREMTALYPALAAGRPSPLPELAVQYPDFAVWQRSWLRGEELAAELAYWRERLADPPPLDLPLDRPRPAAGSFRGGARALRLSPALSASLRALAHGQSASLYMVLLAVWKTLLLRYGGRADLLIGAPVANRNRVEIEGLIGFFVNTLALRTDLAGDPAFQELVGRVRETTLGAYAHQDLPFEKLVEELHPERDTSRNPLFQVAILLQSFPVSAVSLPDLSLRPIGESHGAARFDLQIFMEETADGISVLVSHSADLFDPATVGRLLACFETLAEAAAEAPERRLSGLPLLGAAERQHLLREWNDTAAAYGPGRPGLHRMFEEQARRTPGAPAVTCEERTLTYAELDREANRLAHRLRALGCGPETRVGVAMERSAELVTALLGTLKAGAAYVPLDPEYPADRLAFMLEDSRPAVLLTQARLIPRLPAHALPVLALDEEDLGGESEAPLAGPLDDLQAAYMIYTSGSTGRPKGAVVHHGGIRNRLLWMQEAYALRPADTVLQKTPFSFDVSVWEFFWPLTTGARLVLARPGGHRDGGYLAGLISRERVTVLHFVPSMLQAFLEEPDLARCGSLRLVVASGEALPPGLVRRFFARLDARLENLYGPTEASVDVTAWRCRPGDAAVPIGRPIANTRIHLLDPVLEPVPAGVPGELYIAGANVGRGYLGRPALTAERFVPDPFAETPGERLYRTGDLARHLGGGAVEFLGRLDHQVKLRGFRVELGEVEAVLASHPAVRDCVAMVREDQPGDPRLVAYVVEGHAGDGGEDAAHVSEWRELYDDTYAQAAELPDPTLNLVGWNSSYTGGPIPEEEMREWVETTVARILALRPRHVLEIGCGTGMLLFRIAPACESYAGLDLSRAALDFVGRHLAGLPQVRLHHRTADDLSGFAPGSFDLVILNSVVQCFPGIDYLVRVLTGAAGVLAPGGAVFLGDIRSLPLHRTLAASIELAAAADSTPVSELRRRIGRRVLNEEELLIAPAFFHALAGRVPGITGARVEVKRGVHRNELTAFRYDVTLRAGGPAPEGAVPSWRDWTGDRLSLAALRGLLAEERPEALGVTGIPNARVRRDAAALDLVAAGSFATAGEVRRAAAAGGEGVSPEEIWRLAEELGCEAEVAWSGDGGDGSLDAVFHPPGRTFARPRTAEPARPWRTWANDPLAGRFARTLMPELRALAQEKLPDHAVPAAFVLLPSLPLSPNGKVDRKALPEPERTRPEEAYAAPSDPLEELLAGIWEQVLGAERVGVRDNFFDLGGHSLLATQVAARVRGALHLELPVRRLFEHPTVESLAAALRAGGEERTAAPPLVPAPREGDLPLSFAQQRLWFLYQLDPESPVYNIPLAFRLSGPLRATALARALDGVAARHETLRTTFVVRDGVPAQRIAPPAPLPLPAVDLSALPEAVREAEASRVAAVEARTPFDLSRPPVTRRRLLRLAGDDHVLLFTLHHVSGDGWSAGVLLPELVELYEAAVDGRAPLLPELPVQYADFAVWQRSWLQGAALERQVAYWRRQLAGAPALLELPTDRPRPPVQTDRGARESRRIPAALARPLRDLGRAEGATPFMTLLAGFMALLHRATGQGTVVVGTPIANRDRTEIEGLIGFFANTLALRADLDGSPSFRQLLGRVREAALGAYAHQDLPFERLVDELQPQRDTSHTPVFQAFFVHQGAPARTLRVRDLALRPFGGETATARFDLTLVVGEQADGMLCHLDYNADLFEPATAARLLRLYVNLLESAVESPGLEVRDLPWLDDEERRQVLALAGGETPGPAPRPLHRLFERQAARTPDAPALVSSEATLTYADLDRRANALARRLLAAGTGPESRVGLCMGRSADGIVAAVAVLKTGGAYVPLDPESPRERLASLLADAGAEVLLTEGRLASALEGAAPTVIAVDVPVAGEDLASAGALPDQAAYVIYTSGSTGVPKGVVATHGGAAHFVQGFAAATSLGPDDRMLLFAPLSFDASVLQIFPVLATGGSVFIHPNPRELSTVDILELCDRHRLTVIDLPAPLLRQWVEDVASRGLPLPRATRLYLTGGDSVPAARLRTWAALASQPRDFLTSYGPTEATVTSTVFRTTSADAGGLAWTNVPIGGPLPGTRVYLLDGALRPVPRGIPGEIFLGGPGLARGYLGQPELTAAAFLPDPLSGLAGERLYRTGDLARHLPDGHLEFLGRADHQIKIRGFRLELAEVEAALFRHPAVLEAVVLLREDVPGDRRLVAYAVPNPESAPPAAGELRAFLAERLPQYMVPSAFLVLESLPLMPSGKVDRAALPPPDAHRREPDAGYVAPRTPEEALLSEVWSEVLRVARVGVLDNFFELGGDSILSIQIIARAHRKGLHLTPRQIFEHQTVAELALAARAAAASQAEQGPVSGPVPLTPIQRWFFAESFADPHHFNHALMLEAAGPVERAALERTAAALAAHHDALRLRFHREEGEWRQVNAAAEPAPPLTWIDLAVLPGERAAAALEAAAAGLQTGFDLARGPLARLAFFDLGPERHGRLLWTAHHLVVDGVSWRVLLEDLETAYRQAAAGETPALPLKTTSFRSWSERLAAHTLQGETGYWLEAARAGVPPLPVDFPAGLAENTVASARQVSFQLTPEETQALLQEVPAVHRTQINDALLAALAQAFAGWTGSTALRVDLEGHGREPLFEDVDLSRTVGWLTTQFPVLIDPGEAAGAGRALASVKEQLRRVPGHGVGYGLLRWGGADPEAARALREAPAAQVSFNYLGQLDGAAPGRALFRPAAERTGPLRSRRSHRPYLIEVSGMVLGGRLQMTLDYSRNIHHRSTLERLAEAYAGALRALAGGGRPEEAVLTASDFTLAKLDDRGFAIAAALLDEAE